MKTNREHGKDGWRKKAQKETQFYFWILFLFFSHQKERQKNKKERTNKEKRRKKSTIPSTRARQRGRREHRLRHAQRSFLPWGNERYVQRGIGDQREPIGSWIYQTSFQRSSGEPLRRDDDERGWDQDTRSRRQTDTQNRGAWLYIYSSRRGGETWVVACPDVVTRMTTLQLVSNRSVDARDHTRFGRKCLSCPTQTILPHTVHTQSTHSSHTVQGSFPRKQFPEKGRTKKWEKRARKHSSLIRAYVCLCVCVSE